MRLKCTSCLPFQVVGLLRWGGGWGGSGGGAAALIPAVIDLIVPRDN